MIRAGKSMSNKFVGENPFPFLGADGDKDHFDNAKISASKNFLCHDLCRRPPILQKSLEIDDNFFFTPILTAIIDSLY